MTYEPDEDFTPAKNAETAKHTPGPWRVGDAAHTVFGPPNGNPAPARIADITDKGHRHANARLIAAAPELLEACEGLFYIIKESDFLSEMLEDIVDKAMQDAQAAIRKATQP